MKRMTRIICVVFGFALASRAGSNQPSNGPALRLLLSEVEAGTMASEQYCTLVFADRHFHAEKATRKLGKDKDRRVYEGELSEADWNALGGVLDNKDFQALNVPQGVPPLVIQDAHTYTISVARDTKFQNLEFLDNKSRKPYEKQLKPLLDWWKTFRHAHATESNAPADGRCSLDSTRPVFSN